MRPHPRRARVSPSSPRAWGSSDRNGMIGNHENMVWQWDWAGTGLINKRVLIHQDEVDKPQRQLGTLVLEPDPLPISNARPENYSIDELDVDVSTTYSVPSVGYIVNCSGTFTVTAPAATAEAGSISVNNVSTGVITLSAGSSYTITAGNGTSIISDGTSWRIWVFP